MIVKFFVFFLMILVADHLTGIKKITSSAIKVTY